MHKYVIYNLAKPTPISEREFWSAASGWGMLSKADFYDNRDDSPSPFLNGYWMQVDQARDFVMDDTLYCSMDLCEAEATNIIYTTDRIFFLCVGCLEAFEFGHRTPDYDLFEVKDELPGFEYEELDGHNQD